MIRADWSKEKAFRRDEDGCLIWRGVYDNHGRPVFLFRRDGRSRPVSIKRALMAMSLGRKLRRNEPVISTCGKAGCCKCLATSTPRRVMLDAMAKHDWTQCPVRRAKISAKTAHKYSLEQIADMRRRDEAGEPRESIARLYVANSGTLHQILEYKTYIFHLPPAVRHALAANR